MRKETRKLLDRSFTAAGFFVIGLVAVAILVLLAPMVARGLGAVFFTATVEHRRMQLDRFGRGDRLQIEAEIQAANGARAPVYAAITEFKKQIETLRPTERRKYRASIKDLEKELDALFGPAPGTSRPILMRDQYGQNRWDRALAKRDRVLLRETWDYSDPSRPGIQVMRPRVEEFSGTPVEPVFLMIETHLAEMMRPRFTVYGRFFTDESFDAHFFGGIGPEVLGTLLLTVGAMFFSIPMGVIAAVYLTEYAPDSRWVGFLRVCISALAGVPSIVFGLFGLAFFINTLKVSPSKSVLAGSLTLALMVLPTIIRASEEALRAVPRMYKEAAMSLGAGRWHTMLTVIIPAALPGILTGIVISMGRAAGETAPIIFTAAVSVGGSVSLWHVAQQPTPALSWNIYNLATEHEAMDEIRHVQYGLVLALVAVVLILNFSAVLLRARIAKRLKH